MADHDGLYNLLFDHPDVVAELLREFLAGPWLNDLDLDSMTRENAKFHAATGDRREGDMIWRIPRRDGGDTSHYWMALRDREASVACRRSPDPGSRRHSKTRHLSEPGARCTLSPAPGSRFDPAD